jgi:legumain
VTKNLNKKHKHIFQEDLGRETLHHQFEIVRSRTNSSHVEEYGDLNLGAAPLKDFIGATPVASFRNSRSPPLVVI